MHMAKRKVFTAEELEAAVEFAELMISPGHVPEEVLGKIGPKPPEAKIMLVILPHDQGFICGVAQGNDPLTQAPFIFDSAEKAYSFAILHYCYGAALKVAQMSVAGNA